MGIFKKKLLFCLIISYQLQSIALPYSDFAMLSSSVVYTWWQEYKKSGEINIDANIFEKIKEDITHYLSEAHAKNLLKKIYKNRIITESMTWVPGFLHVIPACYNENYIGGVIAIALNVSFMYLIKQYMRSKNEINIVLKKWYDIEKPENFAIDHSIFFIEYIKLLLNPSTENKRYLDQMLPLYKEVNEIEMGIKSIQELHLDAISFQFIEEMLELINSRITSNITSDFFLSSYFSDTIHAIKEKLCFVLNMVKSIENNMIPEIERLLKFNYVDLSFLNKLLFEYKEKIKKITLDSLEKEIHFFEKEYNDHIEKINYFIKFECRPEYKNMYQEIEELYNEMKEINIFSENLKDSLFKNKLYVSDKNNEINEKYFQMKKTKELALEINKSLVNIKELEIIILYYVDNYNLLRRKTIFNNFFLEYFSQKNYYHLTNEQLLQYQNELEEKNKVISKKYYFLLALKEKLAIYFNNYDKLELLLKKIERLDIFQQYIKNTQKYIINKKEYAELQALRISNRDFYCIEDYPELEEYNKIAKQTYDLFFNSFIVFELNEKFNKEVDVLVRDLEEQFQKEYNIGIKKVIANMNEIKDSIISEILNKEENKNKIEEKINQSIITLKQYHKRINDERLLLERIKSNLDIDKRSLLLISDFEKDEKKSIEKKYHSVFCLLDEEFNNFLTLSYHQASEHNFNSKKYEIRVAKLKEHIVLLKEYKLENMNFLKKLTSKYVEIEKEEKLYYKLLNRYNILLPAKNNEFSIMIDIINKAKTEILKKIDIMELIEDIDFNNEEIKLSRKIELVDLLSFDKKLTSSDYIEYRKRQKKQICDGIAENLKMNLNQTSDEKKAENNEIVEQLENELKECSEKDICLIDTLSQKQDKLFMEFIKK